jgi:outer membrane lipoprotein carrier protein
MKKIIFITLLFSVINIGQAQSGYTPASESHQKEMTQKITETSAQLKTLQCDFVQKKTISILSDEMISEGKMFFKQKDKLRWEYSKPNQYVFVINGDKVMTNTGTAKNIINANSSKIFRRISKIIISGIIGAGIFDDSTFTVKFFVGTKDNMVALTPKQKEFRQIFNEIRIFFNKSDYTVNSVEIEELNGDKTLICMKNKQINKELSDELFIIRGN